LSFAINRPILRPREGIFLNLTGPHAPPLSAQDY
jgi:hypothetical protein